MIPVALGLLLLVLPARAHAESPAPRALEQLAPSARERQAARAAELERAIEHSLAVIPGVVRVEVHAQLPDPALFPLDQPLPSPQMVVAVTAQNADEMQLREALRAALAGAPEFQPRLLITRAPAAIVSKQSAPGPAEGLLKQLLAISLAANVLLATFLLARFKREAASVRDSARGR